MRKIGFWATCLIIGTASPAVADTEWTRTTLIADGGGAGCLWRQSGGPGTGMSVFFDRKAFALIFQADTLPKPDTFIQETSLIFDQDARSPERIEIWSDGLVAAVWNARRAPYRDLLRARNIRLTLSSTLNDYSATVEPDGIREVLAGMERCKVTDHGAVDLIAGAHGLVFTALTGRTPARADNVDLPSSDASPTSSTTTADPSDMGDGTVSSQPTTMSRRDLVIAVQSELSRLGCYGGRSDGSWGRGSRRALARYVRLSGSGSSKLNSDLLKALKAKSKRVCPVVCGVRQIAWGGSCVAKTCPKLQRLDKRGRCREMPKASPRKSPNLAENRIGSHRNCGRIRHDQSCTDGTYPMRCNNGMLQRTGYIVNPSRAAKMRGC